jgi:capsular exopolysaccharide synthesis family protein
MSSPGNTMQIPSGQATGMVDRINVAIHLRRYLKLVARRWFLLLLCIGGLTGVYAYKAKKELNTYNAYSALAFKMVVVTPSGKDQLPTQAPDMVENLVQAMQSDVLQRRVREKLRDYKPAPGIPLVANTRVARGNGNTFVLSVDSHEFEYARLYASNWVRTFVAFKAEQRELAIEEKTRSVRADKNRREQELDQKRQELLDFKKRHIISNVRDAVTTAQNYLERLEAALRELETQRKRLESYTSRDLLDVVTNEKARDNESTRNNNNNNPKTVDPLAIFRDSNYGELKMQLKTRELEYELAARDLKPRHPFMLTLTNQIARLAQDMRFQLESIEDRRKAEIEKLRKDEAGYIPLIEEARKVVNQRSTIQIEYEKLQESEARLKGEVDRLIVDLRALETAPMDEATFDIIDEGAGNPAPTGPDRKKMILTGLMYGSVLGLALVFLLHRLDDRLELAEDVEEQLEEPVLGQIPQLDKSIVAGNRVLVTKLDKHNMFAESIRGVRSAVLFGSQGAAPRIMLVSSAVPGDGKTTFTVNFAVTLAAAGQRVLLVDADLRRGNTHNYFDHPREPGFTEVLLGEMHWEEVVRETEVKTLHVINSGKLPSNPGELLISPVTKEFIEEARKHYDQILFDCPPLTAIDDTFCLLGLSDGLLFVVTAGQTSMRFAKNALAAVRQRGAPIIGVVLNGITGDNPYYYYNYYYHAYYSAGQKATETVESKPAVKMAARKRTSRLPSIDAAAQARVGQPMSSAAIAAEERKKADEFKARRAAQRLAAQKKGDLPVPPGTDDPATHPANPEQDSNG